MRIITIGLSVLLFGFAFAVLAQESTTDNEEDTCGVSFFELASLLSTKRLYMTAINSFNLKMMILLQVSG